MALAQSIIVFIAVVSLAAVCYIAIKSKKPIVKGTASALSGAAALGAVNLLASYTGVGIALNYASAFIAVVLGVPGVIMMLALRLVMF